LLTGLNPGVFVVEETAAPAGYVLADTPQTVEVHAAETQTLTFANVPKQTVTITKYVAGTTTPLPGVTFLITDGGGRPIDGGSGEFVTDSSGRIAIPGMVPGITVTAREIRTASGYALNGAPQSLEVQVGAANALTFYDEPLSVLVIRKFIEGTDREPLSGAAFKVTDGNGANIGAGDGVFYTDNAGEIRIENLEAGTVIKAWEIKTAEGFVLDGTPQDIQIQSGTEHELVFWNKRVGTLTVRKLDSVTRQPLPGVEFRISYADGRTIGDSNGIYTTDSRGEINITGLNGTVVVTETATIPGYVLDVNNRTQTVIVNPMQGKTVTITNDPMQTLTVRKLITGTATPIPGAVFYITDSTGAALGRNNGEFTTDERGEIVVSGLIPGTTVTAREVRPASGYAPNSVPQSIQIRQGDAQTLTFYNTPLENLTITKYEDGSSTPISGVVFFVTDGAGAPIGSGEFVTDDNGRILIPGLVPGTTIIAREVKTVRGYSLNGTPKNIEIQSGKENTLTFYDSPLATLVLHKYVEGTDNQPLPGVMFKVVDGSGKNVGNSDGLFVTDAAGDIAIEGLETGTVIKAREVKTVDGYVLDGTPQDIQIQAGELHELTFYNSPKKGLVIRKYIADSTTPIPGVMFHISDVDGKAFGSSNGDFITDANGEIVLDGLTPGDVLTVKETTAASGFVLDDTPQTIRINR
ncbi:MAG: hypothetical protein J6X53_06590, partial [Abditibacteriota bacterium]|nr:hypothetical protein [Abditibacteriota bacterium]